MTLQALIPRRVANLWSRHVREDSLARLVWPLALASAAGVLLLAARVWHSGRGQHLYLVWNLFLAWVPLWLAWQAVRAGLFTRAGVALSLLWVLFFPNAPYVVTDLKHLHERPPVPLWFDILLLQLFILTSLTAGFLSLNLMQRAVASARGALAGWLFAGAVLALAGFGIYLGRVLRWNSWDLMTQPLDLLSDVGTLIFHPRSNRPAIRFCAGFTGFLWLAYLLWFSFARIDRDVPTRARVSDGQA
jgi:uncharacterized membrane protein